MLHQGVHAGGRRLQVELQGDDVAADLERLVLAGRAAGQTDRPGGKVEGLPVPVEGEGLGRQLEAWRCVRDPVDGEPADLAGRSTIHGDAERARDQLGPQADSQHRDPARHGVAHQLLFGPEPGQRILVVDAHRPAQRDERADPIGAGQGVAREQSDKADLRALRGQPGGDAAQALERNVLEHVNLPHV